MKKRFAQIAGIALAVVLAAGTFLNRPGKINEDILTVKADIFEETESEVTEVLIDEEELPLADAPTVKTTTSTKTTTKKEKMKSASKKTKTTTKTSTKKSKKTVNSSSKTVTKETTVKTTVKTSVKKKSKIKTIRTTVKTTVKTTTTLLNNSTSNVTSGSSTSIQGTTLRQLGAQADSSVLSAFETLGFELKYNSNASYSGYFNAAGGYIELKKANSGYLLHELGHFVSFLLDGADSTSEFKAIYQSEKSKYTGSNKTYVLADSAEYFAESYRNYKENPSKLHSERPETYKYMVSCVENITPSLISEIETIYGFLWK